jgi:DNA polymerase III delta prime subunit
LNPDSKYALFLAFPTKPKESMTILQGPPGIGKTQFLFHLAKELTTQQNDRKIVMFYQFPKDPSMDSFVDFWWEQLEGSTLIPKWPFPDKPVIFLSLFWSLSLNLTQNLNLLPGTLYTYTLDGWCPEKVSVLSIFNDVITK